MTGTILATNKVLVVDDDVAVRALVKKALSADSVQVLDAASGPDALQLINVDDPDLIILDIGLPGTSGLDVLVELRRTSEVPVVLLTGRSDEADRIAGLDLGADDYVVKPFYPGELAARVRSLLRRTRPAVDDQRVLHATRPPLPELDRRPSDGDGVDREPGPHRSIGVAAEEGDDLEPALVDARLVAMPDGPVAPIAGIVHDDAVRRPQSRKGGGGGIRGPGLGQGEGGEEERDRRHGHGGAWMRLRTSTPCPRRDTESPGELGSYSNVKATASVKLLVEGGFASRYQAWKVQVEPGSASAGPFGVGIAERLTTSSYVPSGPEFWTCPGPT